MTKEQTYFISDTHFGHKNIIAYDNRPFFTVSEMDNTLIQNWNNTVSDKDTIYILGDLSWLNVQETANILKQLKGHKHLITGNHDSVITKSKTLSNYFEEITPYKETTINTKQGIKKVVLSHYFIPLYNRHFDGAIHLHGHSHNTREHYIELDIAKRLNTADYPNQIYNVGCMHWNYTPVTLDDILKTK